MSSHANSRLNFLDNLFTHFLGLRTRCSNRIPALASLLLCASVQRGVNLEEPPEGRQPLVALIPVRGCQRRLHGKAEHLHSRLVYHSFLI